MGSSLHRVGSLVVALGLSSYGVGSGAHVLSICGVDFIALTCGLLAPQAGIEPMSPSPALQGRDS